MDKKIEQMAEEHAVWTASLFKWVYKEAFIHGFKHGINDVVKEE